ncbi:MlaD family protein [Hahella ganghwensis]|uniref:MlaD family protein n=1 Tax=Hahella ganghwensis TaxID=286420 RepID=UPI00037F5CA8|nr:MlaD family protein [Hahella ganghwensis]
MSAPVSARMIGLFSIGAIVTLVIGVLVFGSGNLIKNEYPVQMVFTADVKGLNIGAPITYRGVKVGEVTSIDFHLSSPDTNIIIVVSGKIIPQQSDALASEDEVEDFLNNQIAKGLKAQLVAQSILTGLLEIQLDYFPDLEGYTTRSINSRHSIPTVQTDYEIITDTVKSVATQVSNIPLQKMTEDLSALIADLRVLIGHRSVKQSLQDFAETMAHLNSITRELDGNKEKLLEEMVLTMDAMQAMSARMVSMAEKGEKAISTGDELLQSGVASLEKFDRTLTQVDSTLKVYQKLVEPGSEVSVTLIRALQSLNRASEQVRQLAETLERNPESLLTGKQR